MYDPSIHSSFKNVALRQNFTIDDVIAGLEKNRDQLFSQIKTRNESEIRSIERAIKDKQIWFDGSYQNYSSKVLNSVHRAYLYATHMKEAGVETLELDIRSDLADQIIDIARKSGVDISYYSRPASGVSSPTPNCS